MSVDQLLEAPEYSLEHERKQALLTERLRELTALHFERSDAYRQILTGLNHDSRAIGAVADVPMLPVGLFKSHTLRSIPEDRIFKILTSSGTSGATVSRIYLDAPAVRLQTRTLASIMTHWLGSKRLPMIVIDARSSIANRRTFDARRAGIVGTMTFGRDHFYALDEQLQLDRAGLKAWLRTHEASPILLFGYTFIVWEHFIRALDPDEVDLRDGILVHTGGWKKLVDKAVTPLEFRTELKRITGLRRVHNFYGMAEQIGTVFMECEHGHLHAPNAADVVVRDPLTWEVAPDGEVGVAQMLSALPESYPGHSVLTEDIARVDKLDTCPCGRLGKAVSILGRVPRAEVRGCSDARA